MAIAVLRYENLGTCLPNETVRHFAAGLSLLIALVEPEVIDSQSIKVYFP